MRIDRHLADWVEAVCNDMCTGSMVSSGEEAGADMSPMAVVPTEGHNIISGTPTKCEQPGSRQGVLIGLDFGRVEVSQESFQYVCQMLRPCQVDLFVSRLNNQLDWYVSWRPGPFPTTTDALQISWQSLEGYAFSSICSDRLVSPKDQDGEEHSTANSPMLEGAPMAPSSAGTVSEIPNLPASV